MLLERQNLWQVKTRFFPRLLCACLAILMFATFAAAQTFTTPGASGRNWVDTGVDLKPGTLVRLSATGLAFAGGANAPPAIKGMLTLWKPRRDCLIHPHLEAGGILK